MLRPESPKVGRKRSKRRLLAIGLCLAAASYVSVLVSLSRCDSANHYDGSSFPKHSEFRQVESIDNGSTGRLGRRQGLVGREGGHRSGDWSFEEDSLPVEERKEDAPDVDDGAKRGEDDGFAGGKSGEVGADTSASMEEGAEQHSSPNGETSGEDQDHGGRGGRGGAVRKQWPAVLPNEGRSAGMQLKL